MEWDFSVEDCLTRSGCRGARERHEVPRISFRSSRSTIEFRSNLQKTVSAAFWDHLIDITSYRACLPLNYVIYGS